MCNSSALENPLNWELKVGMQQIFHEIFRESKTALVTGGTGFLGRNFVQLLRENGWRVVCLVRPKSKHEHLKEMGAELVLGDFTSLEALRQAVNGVDFVFHLAAATAAVSMEKMLEINCSYTENLVKVCAEQEKPPVFLYVSSLAAAGPSTIERPHEEGDSSAPVSWYGKSKLSAEFMLQKYAGRVPVTVVRPPILFGPFDHEVRKWINGIRKSGFFVIPFLRQYRFSMAHSEDAAQLLLLAALKGERLPGLEPAKAEEVLEKLASPKKLLSPIEAVKDGQGIYYVSQSEHLTYQQIGKYFGQALNRKFTMILPTTPVILGMVCWFGSLWSRMTGKVVLLNLDKFREVRAGSWSCSAKKAKEQLGFQNAHSLLEQCKSTVRWLLEQG